MLGNKHDTYGSNSWMTLSNLKTEKSLVENAEEKGKHIDQCVQFVLRESMALCMGSRELTEDASHRQDEQLQQRVLLLIGQTEEAHLGHFGEFRNSSPYNLMGGRQTL